MTLIRTMALALAFTGLYAATVVASETEDRTAANEHFLNGVDAFRANRFSEAADEFRRAYDLSPAYKVLFNIGQVNAALGDAVAAVDAYEKYLTSGGNDIPKERKRAVQKELEGQRARIGTVVLTVKPDDAVILVDGKLVGKSPLAESMRLTEGKHNVVVVAKGYDTHSRDLSVLGKEQQLIEVNLAPVHEERTPGDLPQSNPPAVPLVPVQSPPLLAAPIAAVPRSLTELSSDTRHSPGNTQRIVGYTVGAFGLVVGGLGAVLAATSAHQASTAQTDERKANTDKDPLAWDNAHSDLESARTRNTLGWVGMGLGTAALASGVVWIVTAPTSRTSTAWTLAPWKTTNAGGVLAQATW